MVTAAQRARAEESEDQADPAHVDPTQIGAPIDSPEAAGDGKLPKGVRTAADGRIMHPWEVDPKDQAGPAGAAARKRKD